jgi:prepilin-type N-terminal cleavage/methylation domain-containing protein
MKKMKQGFTLVEIMIVVAIIGLLAAIAIPSFVKSRNTARKNACINNLRQIDSAKEQASMATEIAVEAAPVLSEIQPYLKSAPTCPADTAKTFATSYSINAMGTAPTCLINAADHVL